ncbi:LysR family transcriptional regulator [Variovorax sp. W2I14]|uniref:LysR family transcriptional regulator n=1 Tax=Variovorax sp. W2I14 TaxID=3042290 RepID=UPI003D20FFBB
MQEIGSSVRPPRRLPPLLSLRAFEAAAAHLSFQRAAVELSVTPSAISHQVRALEDTLGQPLFRRLTRQLALTPAGQRLFDDLRMGFDALEAGIDRLRRPAASQSVTLTTNTAFAARWVLPRMTVFRKACPGIELRLHAGDTLVDLARGDADIAVRSGNGNWPGLVSSELMPERYAPLCSPMLGLRRKGDLPKHQLIHCDWQPNALAPALWSRWFREADIAQPRGRSAKAAGLSFSDETHAMLARTGRPRCCAVEPHAGGRGVAQRRAGAALRAGARYGKLLSRDRERAGERARDTRRVAVDRIAGSGRLVRPTGR